MLKQTDKRVVLDYISSMGHGEWEDSGIKLRFKVYATTLDDLAAIIYNYASDNMMIGDAFPIDELLTSEDHETSGNVIYIYINDRNKTPSAIVKALS